MSKRFGVMRRHSQSKNQIREKKFHLVKDILLLFECFGGKVYRAKLLLSKTLPCQTKSVYQLVKEPLFT